MATAMSWPIRLSGRSLLVLWTVSSLIAVRAAADRAIAITSLTAFSVQRTCVQSCIWNNGLNDVPKAIGCPYPGSDSCICRSDLIPSATDFLSNCVSTACVGNTVDVSSAINLWTTYCSGNDAALFTYAPLASITADAGFKAGRACVQSCIWANGYRDLNVALKCNYYWYDACLCRPDLVPVAESFLSSCVNSACSGNAGDISAAISLSSAYCATATLPVQTGAGATGAGGTSARPAGTAGNGPASTSNAGSGSSSGAGSFLNTAAIIGTVAAAVIVGLCILICVVVMCRRRRRRKEQERLIVAAQQQRERAVPQGVVHYPMQTWPPVLVSLPSASPAQSQVMLRPSGYSEETTLHGEEQDQVPPMQPSPYNRQMRDDDDASSVFSRLTRGSNPAQPGLGPAY